MRSRAPVALLASLAVCAVVPATAVAEGELAPYSVKATPSQVISAAKTGVAIKLAAMAAPSNWGRMRMNLFLDVVFLVFKSAAVNGCPISLPVGSRIVRFAPWLEQNPYQPWC